jgi:hypothetical protein
MTLRTSFGVWYIYRCVRGMLRAHRSIGIGTAEEMAPGSSRQHQAGPSRTRQPHPRFHYPYFRTGFWVRGGSRAFARISSRTLGRCVVVTNPAQPRCRSNGFQRIYVALQTTPEEPKHRNGPLGAPKRRPDPPQPAPHPPRLVCGGNHGAGTHGCPSGGGSPVAAPRPPAP